LMIWPGLSKASTTTFLTMHPHHENWSLRIGNQEEDAIRGRGRGRGR
jgi:hypothetical protein